MKNITTHALLNLFQKVSEVMLFTNAGTDANLYLSFCQWPKDNKKVLVYGYLKGPHDARESCGDYSKPCYITVTAVPALNGCKDCIHVAAVSFFVIFFFGLENVTFQFFSVEL